MKKRWFRLVTMTVLILTMTVLPVLASGSTSNKKKVELNPELTVPSVKTAKSKILKTTSASVKLDSEQIGADSDIVFEKNGKGIYFLKPISEDEYYIDGYEVIFYDLSARTYKTVYSTTSDQYYTNENGIYFLNLKKENQWSSGESKCTYSITIDKYDFEKESVDSIQLDDIVISDNWWNYTNCFGVDQSGRVYVFTNDKKIRLYDKNGKYLSETSTSEQVGHFYGFDPVNGNFYYQSSYNWVYWGYDHDMASLMAGNVDKKNVIRVKDKNMMILYQKYFFEHRNPVAMLNDRYLAAVSTFNGNIGVLLDSNAYDYTDVTEQSTSIDIINNNVSVSVMNVANKNALKAAFQTADSEYENDVDIISIGTRCALNKDATSLLIKTDSNVLTEYDLKAKKEKIRLQTKHPIYTFGIKGERCIVVEKDGNDFYVENLNWNYPTSMEVKCPDAMTVGSSDKVSCITDNDAFKLDYTYESSAPSVVSVDQKGKLNAFKAGTATITVKASPIGITKKAKITVKDSALSGGNDIYKTSNRTGLTSSSITHSDANDYYFGSPQTAYLTMLKDGKYERIECRDKKIVREVYDASFKRLSTSEIPFELSIWGGYFSGEKYNFLLFGKKNTKESNKQEVYRIVKYDKNWKRLGACAIKGANTYVPFDAGGADMTETNGKLYIHTCHTMYKSNDGYHHQANCTFVVNESSLKVTDSYYDVMNLSYGYVSHSFSQKIATDGKYIYRADLGDAYPRGIALTITDVNKKINDPSIYGSVVKIPGSTGANYTGFTLDALKVSEDYYMVAGIGIKTSGSLVQNIYINGDLKNDPSTGATWITNYTKSSGIEVHCPKLVSLNNTQFLLMWEEKSTKTGSYKTKMMLLNEDGQKASSIYTSKLPLSTCDPVVNKKGMVAWYVKKGTSAIFVEINPYQLSKVASATKPLPAKGTKYTVSGNIYQVTKEGSEVSFVKASTKASSLTIPKTMTADKITYKVTSIGAKAFNSNKTIKTVTIGENIAKISNNAFYKCPNLKTVKINTVKLTQKTASQKAFVGANKKLVIKVPAKVKSAYKKIFKGLKVS